MPRVGRLLICEIGPHGIVSKHAAGPAIPAKPPYFLGRRRAVSSSGRSVPVPACELEFDPGPVPDPLGHCGTAEWLERSQSAGCLQAALIAFVILVFMAAMIRVQTRLATAGRGRERRNRALLSIPLIVMWIVAIVSSLIGLTPVFLRNGRFPIPISILILIPIAGVVASIWYAARSATERRDVPAGNTPR